jgi:hypothetical protein
MGGMPPCRPKAMSPPPEGSAAIWAIISSSFITFKKFI